MFSSFKFLPLVLLSLLFLGLFNFSDAKAARWWEITTSDNGSISYIDIDSMKSTTDETLTAWVKTLNKNKKY
jgi:hypothetical protein